MNKKHRKTLDALFASPTRRNVVFRDVAALMSALCCDMEQSEGSRVIFSRGSFSLHIHEPHPGKEIKRYQVVADRKFLEEIGVEP